MGKRIFDFDNFITKDLCANNFSNSIRVEEVTSKDVAIIGIGIRFPGAENVEQFREIIEKGTDCIDNFPEGRCSDTDAYLQYTGMRGEEIKYAKGAYLKEIDKFDYKFFRLTPNEAKQMNPSQRLFLEVAWEAIEDSGYGGTRLSGSNTGVYVGYIGDLEGYKYRQMVSDIEKSFDPTAVAGNLSSIIPSRISYILDLKGPSMLIDTACSSSLVAVHLACQAIRKGECRMAIAGGVRISFLPLDTAEKIGMESSDGKTRTFDNSSDGTGMGEGVAAVLLKPLSKAVADGDSIYAVIKGSAVNQDGSSAGITAPNVVSQEMVITNAWKDAGIDPESITYIEAHGTGTKLGDPIEIDGIQRAFRKFTDKKQFCAIGSVKTNIGHLYEAAGIAALIKVALVIKHRQVPPSLHFNLPNKNIHFEDSPVYVNDRLVNLSNSTFPLRCGVSAFGFSGTNCHMVLEEAPKNETLKERPTRSTDIFVLSARNEEVIKRLISDYKKFFNTEPAADIGSICHTASTGRGHYNCRLAFVVGSMEELKQIIEKLDGNIDVAENGEVYYSRHRVLADNNVEGGEEKKEYVKRSLNKNAGDIIGEFIKTGRERKLLLKELCQMYVNGADIEWESLYEDSEYSKVRLPLYPLEKTRCWIEAPEAEGLRMETAEAYYGTKWVEEWSELSGKKTLNGTILIIYDEKGICIELSKRLREEGREVIEVKIDGGFASITGDSYTVGICEEDYTKLASALKNRDIGTIIHAATLNNNEEINSMNELESSQERGAYSLFHLIKALSIKFKNNIKVIVISEYIYEVTGKEEVIKPENAPLFGLGKAVNLESPNINIKCIDIDRQTSMEMLLTEIRSSGSSYKTAYRNGKRYIEVFIEKEIEKAGRQEIEFKNDGAYVITGGMGGIGLEIAKYMSAKSNINLIFLNRSKTLERSEWKEAEKTCGNRKLKNKIQSIQEIESKGSKVDCYSADVSNEGEMKQVFAELKGKYGRINGIIHCAGITGDGFLANKPEAVLKEVLNPKVKGTWILDRLTAAEAMDFFIMFSSVATIMNTAGQGAYVAANSYMDAYGVYRSKKAKKTLAINWVAWKETGMAADSGVNLDGIFRALPTKTAVKALDEILSRDINRVVIGQLNYENELLYALKDNLPIKLSGKIISAIERCKKQAASDIKIDVRLKGRNHEEYTETERKIAQIQKEVLGFEEINVNDNFFDIGGDSIILTKLHSRLSKEYPGKLTVADLFAYPSVAKLAGYIAKGDGIRQGGTKQNNIGGDIAIIGMSGKFPAADSIEEYWKNIRDGKDCIGAFPINRKDDINTFVKNYMNFKEGVEFADGGYLEEIDLFDYSFFRVAPKEASMMDPNQRLFLETAWKAVEDAGYGGGKLSKSKSGVFLGFARGSFDYDRFVSAADPFLLSEFIVGNLASVIPGRISYIMNLKGPAMLVDTACSSSLVAVHLACKAIRNGECETAIAGGVKLHLLPVCKKGQGGIGIESGDGRARTFDDCSEGTGWGEGIAAVVLKPLSKALRDRDNIYAVIKGSAVNQDGASNGITAPNSLAQADLFEEAWTDAGVDPESISYIEAHGTGTKLGDPVEIDGIQRAFRKYTQRKQFCAIGSVKTNIGHLDTTAGIAGLIKAVMALKNRKIPVTLHFGRPNRNISFEDSPVYISDKTVEWKRESFPLRCGVSAFGFSGTNCHVVLEEAPSVEAAGENVQSLHLFTLSAKTEEALERLIGEYNRFLNEEETENVKNICYTNNTGRGHYSHRIAFIVRNGRELKQKIGQLIANVHGLEDKEFFYHQHKVINDSRAKSGTGEITGDEKREISLCADEKIKEFIRAGRNSEIILRELCQLYTLGADIDWESLYMEEDARKVSLPTYPFEKTRCWIELPEAEGVTPVKENHLYYTIDWTHEEKGKRGILPEGDLLLVIKDNCGGDGLVKKLRERNIETVEVERGSGYEKINPYAYRIGNEDSSYERLIGELKARGLKKILYLGSMGGEQQAESIRELDQQQENGIWGFYRLIRSVVKHFERYDIELVLVTKYAWEVDGKERMINPANAELLGAGRVVGQENPQIKIRGIDMDDATEADEIIDELGAFSQTYMTAYRMGKRYIEVLKTVNMEEVPRIPTEIKSSGVYVITGGMGGIGIEVSKLLASKGKVNLALINRSKLPERKVWSEMLCNGIPGGVCRRIRAIEDLEAQGATVEYFGSDISCMEEMEAILQKLRQKYGRINGVVHGAGVPENEWIIHQKEEVCMAVVKPKVYGTWILDRLTERDDLDFFVMFSSVASLFSAPGQGCYAAANAYMDAYSAYRRKRGKKAVTINWVTWKETGMAAEEGFTVDTMFKTLTTGQGIGAFGELVHRDIGRVLVGEINYRSKMVRMLESSSIKLAEEIKTVISKYGGQEREKRKERSTAGEVKLKGRVNGKYTETEKVVARVYREVIGLDEVDVRDSFFELGGDSILAIKVVDRINEQLNQRIKIVEIFTRQTIEKIAACVDEAGLSQANLQRNENADTTIRRIETREYYPCSPAQKRLFVLNQLEYDSVHYNISKVLIIQGRLDLARFEDTFKNLVQRHESLRTSFALIEGEPVQIIHPYADFKIQYRDVPDKNLCDIINESIRPFDITKPPLLRVGVVRIGEGRHALIFDMHHIITDGISMDIFTREFNRIYSGEVLPELTLQYKDFAVWQREQDQTEHKKKQEAYWMKALEGKLPVLKMPTDFPRPVVQSLEGDQIVFEIDEELTGQIKKLLLETGVTLYIGLLAVYYIVLSKYTGQEDIIVGTPVAGRQHPGVQNIIGMFVNTLPIRNYPRRDKDFAGFLKDVKSNVLQAFEYEDYTLEELISKLNILRDPGRNPIFDTMFVLQNTGSKTIDVAGLVFNEYDFHPKISKFDFSLEALEINGKIQFTLEYCTKLFEKNMMEKLSRHFVDIINTVCLDSSIKIGDIDLVDEVEKNKILEKLEKDKRALVFDLDF